MARDLPPNPEDGDSSTGGPTRSGQRPVARAIPVGPPLRRANVLRTADDSPKPPPLTLPDPRLLFVPVAGMALLVSPCLPSPAIYVGAAALAVCAAAVVKVGADAAFRRGRTAAPLVVSAALTGVHTAAGFVLGLSPDRPVQSGVRIGACMVAGSMLLITGLMVVRDTNRRERFAAEALASQAADEAERRQRIGSANARVVSLSKDAETALILEKPGRAVELLDAAAKTPDATDFGAIEAVRAKMADAEVRRWLKQAADSVNAGDIAAARWAVREALGVPHAVDTVAAKKLEREIDTATDPAKVRAGLMALSDEGFASFEAAGVLPDSLVTGHAGLDRHVAEVARGVGGEVAAARTARRAGDRPVEVIRVRLGPFRSATGTDTKMVYVDWKNVGDSPVTTVHATLTAFDDKSRELYSAPTYTIYATFAPPGVTPGETYIEPPRQGFVLPNDVSAMPVRATAEITKVNGKEVRAGGRMLQVAPPRASQQTGPTYSGPRGGRFHYSASGKKVYEKRQ